MRVNSWSNSITPEIEQTEFAFTGNGLHAVIT
jgi:hypothetical protein